MDKFLEIYKLPRLTPEEIENLERPITSKNSELVLINFPAEKHPGPGFSKEFNQTFTEELTPYLLRLFQNSEKEGTLPNLFYEANIR